MRVAMILLVVLGAGAWGFANAWADGRSSELAHAMVELDDARVNPVTKVVNLLTDMKAQVEKEAEEDKEIYEKMDCWCKTNDREKSRALEIAEAKINELTAFIEESGAKVAQLTTEIEQLKEDIEANVAGLEKATAMREKEAAEFSTEEKDMMDVVSALKGALEVLAEVQLLQKAGRRGEAAGALLQVKKDLMTSVASKPHYRDVMQKDLWDLLSTFGSGEDERGAAFMRPARPSLTGALQTSEADGQQPIEGGGGVAGAKSYNSQSGQIFGMLKQMKDEFTENLSEAQKQELAAQVAFAEMKAAKEAEIAAAKGSVDSKTEELAETNLKMAQAKEDLEDTTNALSADQKFLLDLKKRCAESDESYAARQKERQDEVVAIGETIKILTDDDARDLMHKTVSLVQVGFVTTSHSSHRGKKASTQARRRKIKAREVGKLLQLAKRTGNTELVRLAVSAQLDGFEKVKKAMDDMTAELKKQQKEEVAKNDFCKAELDQNEDTIKVKEAAKGDLDSKITDLEGTVESLTADITALKAANAEMRVQLKRAGEDRAGENKEFQQAVADQRATVVILNKALDKLKSFYAAKGLIQVNAHGKRREEPVPGAAAPPPPPSGKAYSKSGGAGGVMQLIQMIIEEAERADAELVKDEQEAQEAYASLVTETNNTLEANAQELVNKSEAKAQADVDRETAKQDLDATMGDLQTLTGYNGQLHQDCDYVLKNFDIRQAARQKEIDAIAEAKAILSGADFS